MNRYAIIVNDLYLTRIDEVAKSLEEIDLKPSAVYKITGLILVEHKDDLETVAKKIAVNNVKGIYSVRYELEARTQ